MKTTTLVLLTLMITSGLPVAAQDEQTVRKFYQLLSAENASQMGILAPEILAADWKSYTNDTDYRPGGGAAIIATLQARFALIPDLACTIKQLLKDGNHYMVRCQVTGTPNAVFMGIPFGGKRFNMMTLDIHTVENGKITTTYHVEDWDAAKKQLAAH